MTTSDPGSDEDVNTVLHAFWSTFTQPRITLESDWVPHARAAVEALRAKGRLVDDGGSSSRSVYMNARDVHEALAERDAAVVAKENAEANANPFRALQADQFKALQKRLEAAEARADKAESERDDALHLTNVFDMEDKDCPTGYKLNILDLTKALRSRDELMRDIQVKRDAAVVAKDKAEMALTQKRKDYYDIADAVCRESAEPGDVARKATETRRKLIDAEARERELQDAYNKIHPAWIAAEDREQALRSQKDDAYRERDQLVAALSKMFPSTLGRHDEADVSWENDWRWIVFIQLPTGQASWHIHDRELPWFSHLKHDKSIVWDGHNTEEKYRRLSYIAGQDRPDGSGVKDSLITEPNGEPPYHYQQPDRKASGDGGGG